MTTPSAPIWCVDTSSIIAVRSLFSRAQAEQVRNALTQLAAAGRLSLPPEVVAELERYGGKDNPALHWSKENHDSVVRAAAFDDVREVLRQVPEVVDADKEGVEDADPYVLALAMRLVEDGKDARIVTEEFKTTAAKMNLGSAAGYLRIPSMSLRAMLKFEGVVDF
jgi:hypothetical protein